MPLLLACCLSCSGGKSSVNDTEWSSVPVECVDVPQVESPGKVSDQSSGFEYCYTADAPGEGFINRVGAATCLADPSGFHMACDKSKAEGSTCAKHADCGPGGFCEIDWEKGGLCGCIQLCTKDSDCGAEQICICPAALDMDGYGVDLGAAGTCVTAGCLTSADCGGNDCGLSVAPCFGATGTFCRAEDDACRSDASCDGRECARYSAKDAWECTKPVLCE